MGAKPRLHSGKEDKSRATGEGKQSTKLDFGWVSLFTLSLTVFTAVVFGAGKAYRQQFLASFGFSDSVLPWSVQDVAYLGITKQLPILLTAPLIAIGAVLGFTVLIIVLHLISDRLVAQRVKRAGKIKTSNTKSNVDSLLEVIQFVANCLGSVLLVGLLAIFLWQEQKTWGALKRRLRRRVLPREVLEPRNWITSP